ncbi:MAG: tRNA (adenosine(37)-N6)-threonylcarbamoyltransferase complex dimerization subunit type 1 TsaB [Chloroflexi bacterium]|nr:tRNA (adenosine(37)-N6)-threonylcarbamoyltransferase complex dimerization subunit type 1 TsaB [Chloroflexota bacterium]MDA1272042.1 tRNA (adenosine(37)-N6)-threonylcarbamoyltransferase complex dimerization subunit type 1 TsaB [Chloroflexota bacterium]PKB59299.1 MAG: tRNA (adenosine(37)-N6)-threonylcarbamoyltransferase complex dimerization subunit type 1 TsaB [SAR202 cluster bacterium Casp-Chloro-G2]
MLLAIDTSTRYASVGLADDSRVVASRTWYSTINHTAELMPAVAQILDSHGLSVRDLDAVAVALGPGGFSALRVGVSAAKGLALAARKPIVGVGTLDLEAYPYLDTGMPVCALLEAGRQECATALFAADGVRVREDRVSAAAELLEEILDQGPGQTIFCGEGVSAWRDQVSEKLGGNAVIIQPVAASRVWALAAIGRAKLAAGEAGDLTTLQPEYLRMPSIGVPKQRDRVPQGGRPTQEAPSRPR